MKLDAGRSVAALDEVLGQLGKHALVGGLEETRDTRRGLYLSWTHFGLVLCVQI